MSLKEYIGEIIAFVSGGGLLGILGFFRDKRKDKTDQFTIITAEWKKIYDDVLKSLAETRENERQCELRYQQLTDEFNKLRDRDTTMSIEIKKLNNEVEKLRKLLPPKKTAS
jgi:archaellum component FlaC